MQHGTVQRRLLAECIFHAVYFEGIATVILAPTTVRLVQRSVLETDKPTTLLVITAMIWNITYNVLLDRLWSLHLVRRTAEVRALHASGFENSPTVIRVNIMAYALNVSLVRAFMLGIGFSLFLLPYTMFYNWAYDTLRECVMKHRQQHVTA